MFGDLFPLTGDSAGLVRDILRAAEVVRRMIGEAEPDAGALSKSFSSRFFGHRHTFLESESRLRMGSHAMRGTPVAKEVRR